MNILLLYCLSCSSCLHDQSFLSNHNSFHLRHSTAATIPSWWYPKLSVLLYLNHTDCGTSILPLKLIKHIILYSQNWIPKDDTSIFSTKWSWTMLYRILYQHVDPDIELTTIWHLRSWKIHQRSIFIVVFHIHGPKLAGPDAFRVQNMAASWTQQVGRDDVGGDIKLSALILVKVNRYTVWPINIAIEHGWTWSFIVLFMVELPIGNDGFHSYVSLLEGDIRINKPFGPSN